MVSASKFPLVLVPTPISRLSFFLGKGKDHLVPVFFTKEVWKGMVFLCDKSIRAQAGVNIKNEYIFASTRGSDSHVNGWHCMNEVLLLINYFTGSPPHQTTPTTHKTRKHPYFFENDSQNPYFILPYSY